jgi:hypothetical protein
VNHKTESREWKVVTLFFLLHVVLTLPILTPNLKDIGAFDEASYVQMGRTFGLHSLPPVNQYPLAGFFFALTYLPVHSSDFWFVYSCTVGRFLLLVLLWISSYTLAKRLSGISSPLVMIGFLLVSPAAISLTRNASHALFAVMATVALAQIISFRREGRLTNLRMASVFLSLALLSRVGEGTLLFGSLIGLSILLGISAGRVKAVLTAAALPFVVITAGYMLICYVFTGKSPLGTGDYFYTAFEQGHGLAYANQFPGSSHYAEGEIESRRVFGTPEENKHSVITAIRRNPVAYVKRIPRLAKEAVSESIGVYGGALSLWLFLLALYGCIELVRRKDFMLLCILVFWLSYLVIYILLVFQPSHLLLPFPVVFCFASIGLTSLITASSKQRLLASVVLLGFVVLAAARNAPLPFICVALVPLVGLWIVWTVSKWFENSEVMRPAALVFLLSIMLLFAERVPQQKLRKLGIAPEEQAMLFLKRNFEEGTAVGAYTPAVPWAAKLKRVTLVNRRTEVQSEQDLQRWIRDDNLHAIYVDGSLRRYESSVWALIEAQIGKTMDIAFVSDDPDIEILRIRSSYAPPSR